MKPLKPQVQKFFENTDCLERIMRLPDTTATATQAGEALNVDISSIGKSIVVGNKHGQTVVVVLSGSKRVDLEKLKVALNISELKKLNAYEVEFKTGFSIGGVCPFGLPPNVLLVLEKGLEQLECICVAAGDPFSVIKLTWNELIKLMEKNNISYQILECC